MVSGLNTKKVLEAEERARNIDLLRQIAKEKGLSADRTQYLERLMIVESDGLRKNPNGNSHALGLYQFMPDTWDTLASEHPGEIGVPSKLYPDSRLDPRQQILAAIHFTNKNEIALKKAFGDRELTHGELYLAHFLGVGGGNGDKGAIDVIKEAEKNPNTSVKGFLRQLALDQNSEVWLPMQDKKGLYLPEFAVGDLVNWSNGKFKETDQSKYYKTTSEPHYKRDKFGVPESMGNWVMVAIAAAVVLAVALISEIGDMFSDGDAKSPPPNTPRRPTSRGRA